MYNESDLLTMEAPRVIPEDIKDNESFYEEEENKIINQNIIVLHENYNNSLGELYNNMNNYFQNLYELNNEIQNFNKNLQLEEKEEKIKFEEAKTCVAQLK